MVQEAIVLAGGLGTRLRSVVSDVPKPMAQVAGKPFIAYIIDFLVQNGINHIVFAIGYKGEIIRDFISQYYTSSDIKISFSVEEELLGTGGGIFQAASKISESSFFILNGDSFFDISLRNLSDIADQENADLVIALKKLPFSNRYGTVEISPDGNIKAFRDKSDTFQEELIINGGIYLMKKNALGKFELPNRFSFEKDFLQPHVQDLHAYGKVLAGHFIDIGIPEDFHLAQNIFGSPRYNTHER